ncbi:MAG TPA: hypothetical protein VMT35_14765 [Ignavibacteriaceae bacterium]|nr:hypothetical protein [Ignavibacteriaceae bacterium]
MKKVIVIEERKKASLLEKAVRKFFTSSSFNLITTQDLIHLIQSELPDFLYIDLKQPVNEDTMMRMLCQLDEKTRLRVTIFNTGSFRFFMFNLIPFDFIKFFISSLFARAEEHNTAH